MNNPAASSGVSTTLLDASIAPRGGELHPQRLKGENMTKAEFVAKLAEKSELKKSEAEKAVNAFLETVTEALKAGDKVVFTGFGSFEVTERAAKEGRNPSTGEKIQIKATKAPKFKAGKGLKDAVA